jgi:hypothetical protein
LNSSNSGGGFRPLNQFHDDEGECDQDRAFRSFEAASVVGRFYAPLITAFLARLRIDFSIRLRWQREMACFDPSVG